MSVSNLAWNLWSEQMTNPADDNTTDPQRAADAAADASADRWIWGVWIVVALVSVAVLPFASRFKEVATAIASFCGITLS